MYKYLLLCVTLGSVEVDIIFQYSLVHRTSINDQVQSFNEDLINALSNVGEVDK